MPDGYQIIPFDVKNLFKNVPLTDQYFHHIETSHLICSANQMTGFYMMETLVVKGLNETIDIILRNVYYENKIETKIPMSII